MAQGQQLGPGKGSGKRESNGRCQEMGWRKRQQDLLIDLMWKKERDGRNVSPLITFHREPRASYNLQESVKNENVGSVSVGPMDGTGHRSVKPTLGEPEPTPLAPPGLSSFEE